MWLPMKKKTREDRYSARRARFFDGLNEGVALLFASPEASFGHDTLYRYRPDPDLFYLTGFPEPHAVGVFDADTRRTTMFVRRKDRERETWEGRRAGPKETVARHGADEAYPIDELDQRLPDLLRGAKVLHHALGLSAEADRKVIELLARFRREVRHRMRGPVVLKDPTDVLHELRVFKDTEEIATLSRSCEIAAAAHRDAMSASRAGLHEFELQAVIERRFVAEGAAGPSYGTIVGSGPNATILHYVENRRRLEAGELVLVDAGCELDGYASDITRTFPVSGRFDKVSRRFYEIVLDAQKAALAEVRPGGRIDEVHLAARRRLIEGCLSLALLKGKAAAIEKHDRDKPFVLHKTSHYLGLDVHDRGRYTESDGGSRILRPGMVITVEPGLYVRPDERKAPEKLRGLGVRIEDDVLVTPDGHRILTDAAPKSVAAIESLMNP